MRIAHAHLAHAKAAPHLKVLVAASVWTALRRWGGVGLLLFGVLNSSFIPTFGSLDIFNAILAVRHRDLWWYYALMCTIGSALGAYITYRVAKKAGMSWMHRHIGPTRTARVHSTLERWGSTALLIAVLVPPPFPTAPFLVAAGALEFPLRRFMTVVVIGRACRYSLIAWLASHYSRHIIRFFRHPERYAPLTVGLTVLLALFVVAAALIWHHTGVELKRTRQQLDGKHESHIPR